MYVHDKQPFKLKRGVTITCIDFDKFKVFKAVVLKVKTRHVIAETTDTQENKEQAQTVKIKWRIYKTRIVELMTPADVPEWVYNPEKKLLNKMD